MVLPRSNSHDHDGYVVFDTPDCRETFYGHRLVLDDPPADPEAWFARWEAHHGPLGIGRSILVWEHRRPETVPIPPGSELEQYRVLMHDSWEEPTIPTDALRPLLPSDAEALFALSAREFDSSPASQRYVRWYLGQLWAHRANERAAIWGAFDPDGRLIGSVTVVWGRSEARLQNVLVSSTQRRKGHATRLVRAALGSYREYAMGICYVVATDGSDAHELYRKVDFRNVTYFFELARDLPGKK